MPKIALTAFLTLGLCAGASAADIISQWNFNNNPPDASTSSGTLAPAIGSGSATAVGTVATTYNPGSPSDTGADNTAWRTANFPPQGTGNKTCGLQFNLSTAGYKNITLSWDQANSAGANKYYRVQYSIDSGATWVDKDVVINPQTVGNTWNTPIATISFADVSGANQNPNFAVRIVSELESTAVGGLAEYVAVVPTSAYSTTAFLRVDLVTFSGEVDAGGEVNILSEPASQVVAVGQPASFQVLAGGGISTITYQWRKNGIAILNATNSVYAIASAQLSDAGDYDVVVANAVGSKTSVVATLTVRVPVSLAWTGFNGPFWDLATLSWENTGTATPVAYTDGDHVLFDSRGNSATTVNLSGTFNPSSVTINADFDYTLRSDVSGRITGTTGLRKSGTGTLVLNTDNTYTGPTVIEAGTLQLGMADDRGSIGTGPLTNNGALVFNRADNVIITNAITSIGALTNLGKAVTLSGPNTFSGPIANHSSTLTFSGDQVVTSSDIFIATSTAEGLSGATRLALAGGMVIGSGTTIHLSGSAAVPDLRCTLSTTTGSNTINGPIVMDGSGNYSILPDATSEIVINGPVSWASGSTPSLTLRGAGNGFLNGAIDMPGGTVHKTDSGTWTIKSSGNSWAVTSFAVGTLRLGAHNALPTNLSMSIGQPSQRATLDLAGFNQQIASLADGGGNEIITNSSATANSTLTVGSGTFSGRIADSAAGPKTSLTIDGTTFTLTDMNTYSGDTTVQTGTLALSGAGEIPNSAAINLAGGALDVSARSDATLFIGGSQTLKGNGTLSVTGNVANNGTIELKVNKSAGVATTDKLAVSGQLMSGGTLKLNLSGEALAGTDVLEVFVASTLAGSVPVIQPDVPAPGAAWDTSTLLTDGKLRVSAQGGPVFSGSVVSGTDLILSGSGGIAFGTFSLVTSTNVAAATAEWTVSQTGSFDTEGKFSVTVSTIAGEPMRFYRLRTP